MDEDRTRQSKKTHLGQPLSDLYHHNRQTVRRAAKEYEKPWGFQLVLAETALKLKFLYAVTVSTFKAFFKVSAFLFLLVVIFILPPPKCGYLRVRQLSQALLKILGPCRHLYGQIADFFGGIKECLFLSPIPTDVNVRTDIVFLRPDF